jgi:acyl-coenzyme A thioesterase PaaI-like protein
MWAGMTFPAATGHPLNSPLGRFGVTTLLDSPERYAATLPLAHLRNPLTGAVTLGPLAVLVDYVAGLVNHLRRDADEWTVSSELSLDLTPDAATVVTRDPEVPVLGTAHPFGTKGSTSLGVCTLTHDGVEIGTGSVRSVHIPRPEVFADPHDQRPEHTGVRLTELADIMSVRVARDRPGVVLYQQPTSGLNNDMGIVNGGVAATGLELVAAAALNADRSAPLRTASLRVSFLRPLLCGNDSRYEATVLRTGRRTGMADAVAIGADGAQALAARVTAYS